MNKRIFMAIGIILASTILFSCKSSTADKPYDICSCWDFSTEKMEELIESYGDEEKTKAIKAKHKNNPDSKFCKELIQSTKKTFKEDLAISDAARQEKIEETFGKCDSYDKHKGLLVKYKEMIMADMDVVPTDWDSGSSSDTEEIVELKNQETEILSDEYIEEYNSEVMKEDQDEKSWEGQEIIEFPDVGATFPGGVAAMQKWISENVQYPQTSIEMNEQGRVYLSFVVEPDGSITNIVIERGVSQDLDREAKRLMRKMPKWIAGKAAGRKARTRCRLPINFTLN